MIAAPPAGFIAVSLWTDKLPRLVGLHDPRQTLLLFGSSTTLLSKDWIDHGLNQLLCLVSRSQTLSARLSLPRESGYARLSLLA